MENWETIAFTISLLLLVIAIGLSPFQEVGNTIPLPTLLAMILVSVSTWLDTLSRQQLTVHSNYKKLNIVFSIILGIAAVFSKYLNVQIFVQYLIIGYVLISIIGSMYLTQKTKTIRPFKHLEKSNKVFAWIFILLVPVYFVLRYILEEHNSQFRLGFLLYLAFIALAISKIYDDINRLSLVKGKLNQPKQHFQNYGLTKREQEVTTLLLDGLTYQQISKQLFISMPTVKTHAGNIYKKCKVKNRNELMKLLMNGLFLLLLLYDFSFSI